MTPRMPATTNTNEVRSMTFARSAMELSSAPTSTRIPGIRLSGGARHDQARAASPQEAVANGADLLVIGRAVTAAEDPAAAAAAIAAAI